MTTHGNKHHDHEHEHHGHGNRNHGHEHEHYGQGKGLGKGPGHGRHSGGGYGPSGFCICNKCGAKVPHERGIQCTKIKCPNCGHTMIREALLEEKKKK